MAAARRIVEIASRQHGVISVAQIPDVSRTAVRTCVDAGWLRRVHRGVYSLSGSQTRRGIWMAAVLACDGSVLSHVSAAELWRLLKPKQGPVDVIAPTRTGRRCRSGIRVHRPRGLPPSELFERDGIPVTSPARTLLDLASTGVTQRQLERAADEAERLGLCGESELRAVLGRHPGRRGTGVLRTLLDEHALGSTLTRLELEERFLLLCRGRKIPQPLVNAEVLGLTPDFLWPRAGLVVEVDGRGSHDTRRGFQDDRDRDSLLTASGYRVMRFTWWDVLRRPAVVAHRIAKALETR